MQASSSARARDLDHAGDLALVDLGVGADPGADQSLDAHLVRDARRLLVAVGAREGADPARVRPDDLQPLADLRRADLRARRLAFEVGAEAQAVHAAFQHGLEGVAQRPAFDVGPDLGQRARPGAALCGDDRHRTGAHGLGCKRVAARGVLFGDSGFGHRAS
jgi:hypothetical protein